MTGTRRSFLTKAGQAALAMPALQALAGCATPPATPPLAADPAQLLDLPEGFSYFAFGATGSPMDDGLFTPSNHDGMAAFPISGDADRCVLVRNHEIRPSRVVNGAFGADFGLAARIDPALIYDRAADGRPLLGGTTTLTVNVRERRLEHAHLSLAGTATNCAGGATPWGSWLTCEETQETPGEHARKPHGFVFEVPAAARGLATPTPLTAMGRFRHEACVVDPTTGAVYLSEDEEDGLFYRFLPTAPGQLARGGRLQALVIEGQAGLDTRNWSERGATIPVGASFGVRWIDLADVEAPAGDLRLRGHGDGAAVFARGEGLCLALERGLPAIYFACTTGGQARKGQVWRLAPGAAGAADQIGLFAESTAESVFDMVDNIVTAPWGDLILCEDGEGDNYLRGLRADGSTYPIARVAHASQSEVCGACFSPDGSTLFVNIQTPGVTVGIQGPWRRLAG